MVHALVDVTRAQQLESWHTGVLVVAHADGHLLGVFGDASRRIFPRSAIKIIQALPLVESGAADHFGFSEAELALACASHAGAGYHVAMVGRLLERVGLDVASLACGGHMPLGEKAQKEVLRAGLVVTPCHNNCSGKHAGMLATAVHLDEATEDYELAHHDVQCRIKAALQDVVETDLSKVVPGIDGCSAPNWPLPIDRLAIGFARIVAGKGYPAARGRAFERLIQACWAAPEAMSGKGRFDTEILRRFAGEVFVKGGAEGVYCGGIRSLGIGFALKVDDGAQRAAEAAASAVIARFVETAADLGEPKLIENAAGIAVGDIRANPALTKLLANIQI